MPPKRLQREEPDSEELADDDNAVGEKEEEEDLGIMGLGAGDDEEDEEESGDGDEEGDDNDDEDDEDSDNEDDESLGGPCLGVGSEDDGDEEEEEGGADAMDDDDLDADDEDDEDDGPKRGQGAKFSEGGKGESFAKAFAKIMQRKVKAKLEGDDAGAAADLILAESSSVQKRKAMEQDAAKTNRALKKARLEMKKRGHQIVPRRGEDPAHDLREKQLSKMATRGVVILFNAVQNAQKQKADAANKPGIGAASKAAKLNKASFLAQLKSSAGATESLVPGGPSQAASQGPPSASLGAEGGPGWKVLQDSFTGLSGKSKMKDWDKTMEDDSDAEPEGIDIEQSSDEGDGW